MRHIDETGMTTEFIRTDDKRWVEFLSHVQHDIYHLPEYLEFTARNEGGEPLAFYLDTGDSKCLIPLLRRALPNCLSASGKWYDLTSPYGYASPLYWPEEDDSALMSGLSALKNHGAEKGLVSAFLRFHLLLNPPQDSLGVFGALVAHGQTVYVDLNISREEIWRQTRSNHRSGIHKLIREGFEVVFNNFDLFDEYISIYRKTMERVGANEFYSFSDTYFKDLVATFGKKISLVCVLSPSGEIACGGLFSAYNGIIQLIFSGTHESYLSFSPSKLMIDFVRRWGMDHNFKFLHSGGGVGASADQLLHFKAGFSGLRGAYHTLRVVFDHEVYGELNQKDQILHNLKCGDDNGYFPLYRKPFYHRIARGDGNAKTQAR